jgi:hypothetical protein
VRSTRGHRGYTKVELDEPDCFLKFFILEDGCIKRLRLRVGGGGELLGRTVRRVENVTQQDTYVESWKRAMAVYIREE